MPRPRVSIVGARELNEFAKVLRRRFRLERDFANPQVDCAIAAGVHRRNAKRFSDCAQEDNRPDDGRHSPFAVTLL